MLWDLPCMHSHPGFCMATAVGPCHCTRLGSVPFLESVPNTGDLTDMASISMTNPLPEISPPELAWSPMKWQHQSWRLCLSVLKPGQRERRKATGPHFCPDLNVEKKKEKKLLTWTLDDTLHIAQLRMTTACQELQYLEYVPVLSDWQHCCTYTHYEIHVSALWSTVYTVWTRSPSINHL